MWRAAWFSFLLCSSLSAAEISLIGILGEKVLVQADGERTRLLAVGQSIGQARLLAVNPGSAQFDIGGRRITLTLDNRTIKNTPETDSSHLRLSVGEGGHFLAHLRINALPLLGIIDTGATTLAISSIHARMAGIDPSQGVPGRGHTAQGWVETRKVRISRLNLGHFTLYDVDAVVVEGEFPLKPLIGMNVLQRFTMQREADQLTLQQRY